MITYAKIDKSNFTDIDEKLINYVSDDRKQFILRNKNISVKLLSLYAELLLRFSLSKYYGISSDVSILKDDFGKPFLSNINGIDVNMSHTTNMIMCGISDAGKIGVDVEHLRKINFDVAKKVFHENEIAYINSPNVSDEHFLEIWTKKEAYTKYLGTGLRYNLTDIDILSSMHASHLQFWQSDNYFFSAYSDENDEKCISFTPNEIAAHFIS